MKSSFSLLVFVCLLSTHAFSQKIHHFWSSVDESSLSVAIKSNQQIHPTQYESVQLDFESFTKILATAPQESATLKKELLITLPLPDGSLETFAVVESSVMEAKLQAKYPQIRSFVVWGTERPDVHGRVEYSPNGFNAFLSSQSGSMFISPIAKGNTDYYFAYTLDNYDYTVAGMPVASCGYNPATMPPGSFDHLKTDEVIGHDHEHDTHTTKNAGSELPVRKYRFALACTGEYAQGHGGTVASVLASYNTAVNRVNEIFETEVGVRMILIDNVEEIIFLDPDTDPYQNSNVGTALLGQNEAVLNRFIPPTAYELGHVFTAGCTDVGGVVNGSACGQGKARGVTCHSTNNVVVIAQGVMAHEIAHQFGTSHSWNNCPGSDGQRAGEAAFEPGSGTTIMSYNGACGPENNIPGRREDYYHVGSLVQYTRFTREEPFGPCGTQEFLGNTEPIIEWTYDNGFYIPVNTPFELNTTAVDMEDQDRLTYCWEQYDLGPPTPLGRPILNAPLFRTFAAVPETSRVFPRMASVVGNIEEIDEVLPTYSRDLTFRCTVRDNHPGSGAAVWEEVKFKATESAGPFLVTSPNADSVEWEVGSYQEITWDVANTNGSLVNCQRVDIRLSMDGGFTYPVTLAEGVRNDGSEFVVIPDVTGTRTRVRVEASDNVFFDISNANFTLTPATTPGYALQIGPSFQQLCQPASANLVVETTSLLEYDSLVTISIVEGLPEGAVATIENETLVPGENTNITIDFSAVDIDEEITVVLQAIAGSSDTLFRSFDIDVVNNDFSALVQTSPSNGVVGIDAPVFEWVPSPNANTYDFEVATSPLFGDSRIVTETGLTDITYTPDFVLEENTVFYWRVRANNECGVGEFTIPFAFRTQAISCAALQPEDTPITLSGSGQQTRESLILVQSQGTINDMNIPIIQGQYQTINGLRFTVISPDGKEAVLFDQKCGATSTFEAGFDDQAPTALACPPINGVLMRPQDPLAVFNGDNTQGLWTLRVEVVEPGFGGGGSIDNWEIEFCGNLSPSAPFLVNNETWALPPNTRSQITPDFLLAEDANNTSEEIFYTIVSAPEHGTLYLYDEQPLSVGDRFRQVDINSNNLYYEHEGNEATEDKFVFTVEDTESGWFGTPTFNISIDESAVVNTTEVSLDEYVQLFPNPVQQGELTVVIGQSPQLFKRMNIISAQGQLISTQSLAQAANRWTINTGQFATGIYFLQLETSMGTVVKRFTIVQ
ncbi:MAG: reprolysin-like metallopeptidase [Bacteroidota bacterium]